MKRVRRVLGVLFHRVSLTVLFMLIQLVILVVMTLRFQDYFVYFYAFCILLSMLIVLHIINGRSNPAYKLAWIIPILLVPFFGGLVYMLFSPESMSAKEKRTAQMMMERLKGTLTDRESLDKLLEECPGAGAQSRYINDFAFVPPCRCSGTEYLPLGEAYFERLKEKLELAEHYIYLEYFIIQEGVMWNAILEILLRKVSAGVDVRLMYDDMGCMFTLPSGYDKKLESMGIQCCVFSPFRPVLSSRFNNRNHRKIAVIDGHTAFTGGINLADEYINAYEKHGHWKDTGIMVRGHAAWSMTVMFLTMWQGSSGIEEDFDALRPALLDEHPEGDGYVQPYADSPLDGEAMGESVYMNMIYRAERKVYITTPYLIVGHEMIKALTAAAKCGLDIRIITPHIADKWYVHAVTRSYYEELVESGVRIYEYTPGFIHAKSFVVDGSYGVVGTVNLDYRSLYLHYECGVWLYKADCVSQIEEDFLKTLELCQEITLEDCRKVPWYRKLGRSILSVFSPLM